MEVFPMPSEACLRQLMSGSTRIPKLFARVSQESRLVLLWAANQSILNFKVVSGNRDIPGLL